VPNNLATVEALQGDAGDSADGFDDAFSAVMGLFAGIEAAAATSDSMITSLSAAIDTYDAINDNCDLELAGVLAIGDTLEPLLGSLINMIPLLGSGPADISLPGIPGLANIVAPIPVDLTSLIEGLVTGAVAQLEQDVMNYLDQVLEGIIASAGIGDQPVGGLPGWGGID
jgi:hypothetical protein